MFEFDHRGRCLLAHVLDGVLVTEPVGSLDGVVHVVAPVVVTHVAQGGRDPSLGGDGVAPGREDLGNAGGRQTGLGQTQGGAQARSAGADHNHVVGVIDNGVGVCHAWPNMSMARETTVMAANTTAAAMTRTLSAEPQDPRPT